jgi:hypothetical protein
VRLYGAGTVVVGVDSAVVRPTALTAVTTTRRVEPASVAVTV